MADQNDITKTITLDKEMTLEDCRLSVVGCRLSVVVPSCFGARPEYDSRGKP